MSDGSNSETPYCKQLTCAIGEIYAAVEDPALWPTVLDRIVAMVGGDNIWLSANYSNAVAKDVVAIAGFDDAALKEYGEHYDTNNVWIERCNKLFAPGIVGYTHWAISDQELQRTEFYDGWLRPNDLGYAMGVIVPLGDQPPAFLSSLRSHKRGPFDEAEGRVFKALLPHLQRALRLHFELAGLRAATQGLELALDAFDRAVFGLNGKGKVLFSNRMASELLREGDGIGVRQGCLVADWPEQDAELQLLLAQAAVRGAGFRVAGALLIRRRSGKPALRVTLMPFAGNLLGHVPRLATLVFVDDPARKAAGRAEVLRAMYRLSPTEARIADLLVEGKEITAAAEILRMSSKTARFHLKAIFRKMGVKRQTDLVRIALGLPGGAVSSALPIA